MQLTAITLYPLKSGRGVDLAAARVDAEGLTGDRRFMVVDARGNFVSQRERPDLARVVLEPDAGRVTFDGVSASVDVAGGAPARVVVWGDDVDARDCGDAAAAVVVRAAGQGARLVRMPRGSERPVDPRFGNVGDVVSFADGFPVLVASTSSFNEVARRVPEPIGIDRFRPNLVVTGSPAFDEDTWATIRIGEVTFDLVKPCARCTMIDLDQATGARRGDVLRALATFRTVKTDKARVLFGENAVPRAAGTVRVGDEVVVVDRRAGA